jgi:hypothetical protein
MLVAALETSSSRCKTGARYRSRSGRIPFAVLRCALLGLAVCCASSVPLGLPFLIRILRHRPQIVLGVLEIILRRDPVSRQSFGAGQHQIALIVSFRALSVSRLGAGEPGRLISAGGLRPSRRCAGRDFRIWAWRCRCGFKFRNIFHAGPYAAPSAPADAVRRSFEEFVELRHRRRARRGERSHQTCGGAGGWAWHPIGNTEGWPNQSTSTAFR